MNPNGPGAPFTLLFADEQPSPPSLPLPLRLIYGGDWHIPDVGMRPYVYSNFAQARDGRVSFNEPGLSSGGEVTKCNPHDRWLMGLLRARADCVLSGDNTVKIEPDHSWTAEFICPNDAVAFAELRRAEGRRAKPLLCIVSQLCDFDSGVKCFQDPDLHIVLATTAAGYAARRGWQCAAQLDVLQLGETWVDLPRLTQILYKDYGICNLLCEGGPGLMGGMLAAGLIDEEFVTLCPMFIGETREKFRPSYVEGVAFLPTTAPYSKPISLRRAGDFLFMQTLCQYK